MWTRTYLVRPAVTPSRVTTVLVLTAQRVTQGTGNVWGSDASTPTRPRKRIAAAGDSLAKQAALLQAQARQAALDSMKRATIDSVRRSLGAPPMRVSTARRCVARNLPSRFGRRRHRRRHGAIPLASGATPRAPIPREILVHEWTGAVRTIVVCAILIVLHYTLRPLLAWRASIDFLIVALLLGSVRLRPGAAAVYGFFLGLMADSLAVSAFGASALGMAIVGFAASWLKAVFFADNLALNGFFLFLAKWIFDLIFLLVGHRAHGAELAMQIFVWSPLSAAVTAVAGVIALSLLKPLMEVRTRVSFHPNDVIRRGRAASIIVCGVLVFLLSAFFRAQVIRNQEYTAAVGGEPAAADSDRRAARARFSTATTSRSPRTSSAIRSRCSRRTRTRSARRSTACAARSSSRTSSIEDAIRRFRRDRNASHGDHSGRVVRRRVGARGAPHRSSRA